MRTFSELFSIPHMKNILIVDDNQDLLQTISMMLEDAGYDSVLTLEPDRAVRLCKEIQFDAVICDLCLRESLITSCPESPITGLDLIMTLIGKFPTIPVIGMSGGIEPAALAKVEKLGLAGLLPKPFYASALIEKLEHAINESTRNKVIGQATA